MIQENMETGSYRGYKCMSLHDFPSGTLGSV